MTRQTPRFQLTAGAGVVAYLLIVNTVGADPTGIQIKQNAAMAKESISKSRIEASANASATARSTVSAKPNEDHTQCTAIASARAQAQAGEEYDKDAHEETVSGPAGECPANAEAKAKANMGSRTNGG